MGVAKLYQRMIGPFTGHGFLNAPPIRRLKNLVTRLLSDKPVRVQGCTLYLDPLDSLGIMKNGCFERFETQIIKQLVKEGDVVVDVGANIGYYTIILSKIVGKSGKVYAFEPDVSNFQILTKNVMINDCTNVELVQKAVTESTGMVDLYLNDINLGGHRIHPTLSGTRNVEVSAISLESYFPDNQTIDFLKMDIEGAEFQAMKGFGTIRPGTMVMEFSPFNNEACGVDSEKMVGLIQDRGYRIFHIDEERNSIRQFKLDEMLNMYPIDEPVWTNILCLASTSC